MSKVDLFLGGDLARWTLEVVNPEHVSKVFTLDPIVAEMAAVQGIEVFTDNANDVRFEPARTGLSVHYPRIIREPLLEQYENIFNLHPGYLPWGRGYYPIFWAIWEQSPAGATLHSINAGIDEGPIVAQRQVEQLPYDTGGSLFERVREAEKEIFMEFWPRLVAGETLPRTAQIGTGTYHSKRDFHDIKQRCEWWKLDSESLVRLIRALTFPGLTGLEVFLGGQLFEMHLNTIKPDKRNLA